MKTKDLTLIALMIALLIISSQLSVPIGPVPMTLQTLAVLMVGSLLSPKNALFATSIYAVMGLAGLPVFSGFSGGLQSILAPSFGFVLGFIPAVFLQAHYLKKVQNIETKHLVFSSILNFVVTYLVGLPYMAFILNVYMNSQMNLTAVLMAGFIPFIPGDLIKLAITATMTKRLKPIFDAQQYTNSNEFA